MISTASRASISCPETGISLVAPVDDLELAHSWRGRIAAGLRQLLLPFLGKSNWERRS